MAVTLNASTSSGFIQTADTSGELNLQSNGTTKLSVLSTGVSGTLVQGTAVASTSGTSVSFTGIPSWVKRITVMFSGVSTNGTSILQVQLGTGATPTYTTSGYSAISSTVAIGGGVGGTAATSGFIIGTSSASSVRHGHMVLTNVSGNTWVSSHVIGDAGINFTAQGGGNVGLGAVLTAVRITTVNGTDTFDAGSINIQYEG
jgi:hypothetical protein